MAGLAEALAGIAATEGAWLLVLGAVLAGVVRGFTGFGTAMVYMPFAAQVLPPVWALVSLVILDMIGPLPAVPRALRDGHPRDVLRLGAGALFGVPLGVLVLVSLPPEPFRYAVSLLTLALLALLLSGVRWRGAVRPPLIAGTGFLGGVLGGSVGLPGPPVILLYMARPLPVAAIRANVLLYLLLADLLMVAVFGWRGLLAWPAVMAGLALTPIYLLSVVAGAAIFDPARERVYRFAAYAIIAGAALGGLPLLD